MYIKMNCKLDDYVTLTKTDIKGILDSFWE